MSDLEKYLMELVDADVERNECDITEYEKTLRELLNTLLVKE